MFACYRTIEPLSKLCAEIARPVNLEMVTPYFQAACGSHLKGLLAICWQLQAFAECGRKFCH